MAAAKVELLPAAAGDHARYRFAACNKPAPAFTLEDLSGKKVSLASYKGKAVLINFWATWCGPCKIETPWLVELRDQYAAKGFEVLGISTEGDDLPADDKAGWAQQKADIAKFVKAEKMPYPVLIDGDSLTKPYGGLDAMPTSFYVDRSGTVVAVADGHHLQRRHGGQHPQGSGRGHVRSARRIDRDLAGRVQLPDATAQSPIGHDSAHWATGSIPAAQSLQLLNISIPSSSLCRRQGQPGCAAFPRRRRLPHQLAHAERRLPDSHGACNSRESGVRLPRQPIRRAQTHAARRSRTRLNVYTGDFAIQTRTSSRRWRSSREGKLHYQACDQNACMPPKTITVPSM